MQQTAPIKRRISVFIPRIKKTGLCVLTGVFLIVGVLSYRGLADLKLSPVWIWRILRGDSGYLKQSGGRTNFLLLGIGGQNHEGGTLTDTIQVVSIDYQRQRLVLIAVPRDLWVPTLKDRINSVYATGEDIHSGSGLVMAKSAVEEVVGLPIHYGALLDFSGFRQIVDVLGGIDVTIGESFTDNEYPVAGRENDTCDGDPKYSCRYKTVTFIKGVEHMDGTRALIFARSRHATGDVGTDFSRGRRQQTVIMAIRDRLVRRETFFDLTLLRQLYDLARNSIQTDLETGEGLLVARLISGVAQNMTSVGLTEDRGEDSPGLLVNPPLGQYQGKWVLVPKSGDFTNIHGFVACRIANFPDCDRYFVD